MQHNCIIAFAASQPSLLLPSSPGREAEEIDAGEDKEGMSPLSMLFDGIMADWHARVLRVPSHAEESYANSPSSDSARSETSTCITTPDRSPQHAMPSLPLQQWKEAVPVQIARENAMVMPGGGPLLDASSDDGLGFWAPTPSPCTALRSKPADESVQPLAKESKQPPSRPQRPARPEHCRETLENLNVGGTSPSVGVVSLRSVRRPPAEYYHPHGSIAQSDTASTFKLAPAPQRVRAATSVRPVERSSMASTATFVSARSETSFSAARARRLEPAYPPSASRSTGLPQQQPISLTESSPGITRRPSLLQRLAGGLKRSPSQSSHAATSGPASGPTDYAKIPRTPVHMITPYTSAPPPAPTPSRKLSFSKRSPTPARLAPHEATEDADGIPVAQRPLARKLSFSQTSPGAQHALRRTTSLRSNPPPCSAVRRSPSRTSIVQAASTPQILGVKKVTFALATPTTTSAGTLSRCR